MDSLRYIDEEDDVYSGYNDYNPALDTGGMEDDENFQQAVKTSYGRLGTQAGRMPMNRSGMRGLGTSAGRPLMTGAGRLATGSLQMADGQARPMTAVRAAGYKSGPQRGMFDPLNQASKTGPAPPLEKKDDDSPDEKLKQLERKINTTIEASCQSYYIGDVQAALEKAKDAGRKEQALLRQREQMNLTDTMNFDITYYVLFNLALQYQHNDMFGEAIKTYQIVVRNKMFNNAGRLKVNMGNIHYRQNEYLKALKFYRMALDQVPNTHREIRVKISHNIGISFVKLGQYADAITTFEHIMSDRPNFVTTFNLILCYYALGDRGRMKSTFQKLVHISLNIDDEDKFIPHSDDRHANLIIEATKDDRLRQQELRKKSKVEKYIRLAATAIAPSIEDTFAVGYDWCVDCVKMSPYVELANELEIDKAIMYLKQREFSMAVETLKSFEKRDAKMASAAAMNLSSIYFLEKDINQADKYAEVAIQSDHYNPGAFVMKGNCYFEKKMFDNAKECYQEALRTESSCTEALFNLGLVNKRLGMFEEALETFLKLHVILRNNPEVIYQIAALNDHLELTTESTEWFLQLLSITPTDPATLTKIAEIYDNEGDKGQSFQYHYESFRYMPSDIETIEWLGAYYIDTQFCEKAIQYFERAALVQPSQVKWQLMIASCLRRSGNYNGALEKYKEINRRFPDNVECLKFLVRLTANLGLKEAHEYAVKLKKAEDRQTRSEERARSGRRTGSGKHARRGGSPDRLGSGGSSGGSADSHNRARMRQMKEEPHREDYRDDSKEVDAHYHDPLGPMQERPMTAAKRHQPRKEIFDDDEIDDDLLPE